MLRALIISPDLAHISPDLVRSQVLRALEAASTEAEGAGLLTELAVLHDVRQQLRPAVERLDERLEAAAAPA